MYLQPLRCKIWLLHRNTSRQIADVSQKLWWPHRWYHGKCVGHYNMPETEHREWAFLVDGGWQRTTEFRKFLHHLNVIRLTMKL